MDSAWHPTLDARSLMVRIAASGGAFVGAHIPSPRVGFDGPPGGVCPFPSAVSSVHSLVAMFDESDGSCASERNEECFDRPDDYPCRFHSSILCELALGECLCVSAVPWCVLCLRDSGDCLVVVFGFQAQKRGSWITGKERAERVLAHAISIDGRKEWTCKFCSESNVWTRWRCRRRYTNIEAELHRKKRQAVAAK